MKTKKVNSVMMPNSAFQKSPLKAISVSGKLGVEKELSITGYNSIMSSLA